MLKLQIEIENNFVELSNTCEKPALIICDRGAMDIAAYFDEKTWESLIGEPSLTKEQLRDERYSYSSRYRCKWRRSVLFKF